MLSSEHTIWPKSPSFNLPVCMTIDEKRRLLYVLDNMVTLVLRRIGLTSVCDICTHMKSIGGLASSPPGILPICAAYADEEGEHGTYKLPIRTNVTGMIVDSRTGNIIVCANDFRLWYISSTDDGKSYQTHWIGLSDKTMQCGSLVQNSHGHIFITDHAHDTICTVRHPPTEIRKNGDRLEVDVWYEDIPIARCGTLWGSRSSKRFDILTNRTTVAFKGKNMYMCMDAHDHLYVPFGQSDSKSMVIVQISPDKVIMPLFEVPERSRMLASEDCWMLATPGRLHLGRLKHKTCRFVTSDFAIPDHGIDEPLIIRCEDHVIVCSQVAGSKLCRFHVRHPPLKNGKSLIWSNERIRLKPIVPVSTPSSNLFSCLEEE